MPIHHSYLNPSNCLEDIRCSEEAILDLISCLDCKTSIGPLSSASNYQPISILSIAGKLLECVIDALIFQHLCLYHPISPELWGFLPERSTSSALLSVTHDWLSHLDKHAEVCSMYFELCKAFNSIPCCLLLLKLADII